MRFLAAVIDGIITALITVIPAIAVGYIVGLTMAGTASLSEIEATAGAIGNLLGILIGWLYFAILESSSYQATFGKRLLGLRVVGLEGDGISFGRATGRHFGKFLSLLTLFIGFFMTGWTKKKQGMHDKMAGCLVVRKSSLKKGYNSHFEVKTPPSFTPAPVARVAGDKSEFEAEALRRYKAGDLSESAFIEIIKRK